MERRQIPYSIENARNFLVAAQAAGSVAKYRNSRDTQIRYGQDSTTQQLNITVLYLETPLTKADIARMYHLKRARVSQAIKSAIAGVHKKSPIYLRIEHPIRSLL